jgi:hypothetical protein
VAGLLEAVALACLLLGVYTAVTGVTRVKMGAVTLVSVRQTWRPWAFAVVAMAMRMAFTPKAPVQIWRWPLIGYRRFDAWRAAHRRDPRFPYALVMVIAVWLSVGPPLGLWPLVYWLPGLSFIRAPSRFTLLGVLGLAMLAGMGFERMAANLSSQKRRVAAVCVGVLLVAEFMAAPFDVEAYRVEIPAIDRWLASQPTPFVLAEVPLGNPRNLVEWERRETTFMLHATAHWQKTVHGYSGFRSELHERLYLELAQFPDERSLRHLSQLGVTDVVVHSELYAPGEWPAIEDRIGGLGQWLSLRHVEGAGRVYALRRPR